MRRKGAEVKVLLNLNGFILSIMVLIMASEVGQGYGKVQVITKSRVGISFTEKENSVEKPGFNLAPSNPIESTSNTDGKFTFVKCFDTLRVAKHVIPANTGIRKFISQAYGQFINALTIADPTVRSEAMQKALDVSIREFLVRSNIRQNSYWTT